MTRPGGPLDPWPEPADDAGSTAGGNDETNHDKNVDGDESPSGVHPLDVLVAGIAAKETAAFGDLYSLVADRLFAFAYRVLGDRHEAEDAVQQAFLELARAQNPPSHGRSLEAWLFTSTRYTCGDVLRSRSRKPAIPSEQVPEAGYEDQYEIGFEALLETALSNLTAQQQAVVHLKHVEGIDGEQIANILGITRMAVYASAARAERRLRQLLRVPEGAPLLSPFSGVEDV